MTIRPLQPPDRAEWLRMRRTLWPQYDTAEIEAESAAYFDTGIIWGLPAHVSVIDRGDGRLGGFVEVSLRPAADAVRTSPVGYIEGWYVDNDLRRQRWGSRLIEAGESWARSKGCVEMASDCVTRNQASFMGHLSMGYEPTEHCILFRKPLATEVEPAADWIGLVPFELNARTAEKFAAHPAAGGICSFAGTTRDETNAAGQPLIALDYEAYTAMAEKQLRDLANRARDRWPIVKLVLLHRLGRVPVGQASVLITVSTPHRAESFEACRFLIDELKKDVAIWKKEVWQDGEATWVHPG